MKTDITGTVICVGCLARYPVAWIKQGKATQYCCSKKCEETHAQKKQTLETIVRSPVHQNAGGSFHQSETPFTP
jgi:hypothetical protein